jgi:8-oxo-dGTP diphosphatase
VIGTMNYCSNCGKPISKILPTTCNFCGSSFYRNPRLCAGALIVKDDQILLAQRMIEPWSGYWDIPGGYCEAFETPEECAIREVYEETGIRIKIVDFHGVWLEPTTSEDYGNNICVYFLAEPQNDAEMKPVDNEMSNLKWFLHNNLPQNIAFESHIPDVLEQWKRSIDGRKDT